MPSSAIDVQIISLNHIKRIFFRHNTRIPRIRGVRHNTKVAIPTDCNRKSDRYEPVAPRILLGSVSEL